MAMINEAILKKLTIDETCYEGNCDEFGNPDWTADEVADPDEFTEIVSRFCLMTPPKKGLRRVIYRFDDHPILWGEVMALINTMDLEELADEVQDEIDSCLAYLEDQRMRQYYKYHDKI